MSLPLAPGAATGSPLPRAALPERWADWRNRLLASPRFRRWAAGFWPTRALARRRAEGLFDLVAGFVYSQVLLACVRLRVFDHLAAGPLTRGELATRLALSEAAVARLMAAAQALGLVEARRGDRWALGPQGAVLVGDQAISAMVEHHGALYADLADPVALLRGQAGLMGEEHLARFWPYAQARQPAALQAGDVADYSRLMSASQPLVAEQVLGAVDFRRFRCLLDVGGGEGGFLAAVATQAPRLALMLFDLPAVVARARQCLQGQGLAGRVVVQGGDFQRDALPRGADCISLVRVVHDHDDAVAQALLHAVHRALPPGGQLLLAEPMADTPGARRMGDAYFGFYLLAMRSGRPRTAEQLRAMLARAGFARVRECPTRQPLQTRVLLAEAGARGT